MLTDRVRQKEESYSVDSRLANSFTLLGIAAVCVFGFAVYDDLRSAILASVFGSIFVVLAISDLQKRIIPNRIVYPALALAMAFSWLWPERSLGTNFLGGGISLGFSFAIYLLSRGGLGAGDVKMAALVGMVLGYPGVLLAGFITAISGGLVAIVLLVSGLATRRQFLAYGPFLALGGLASLFWGV